jgi:hypothetical protein
MPDTSDTVSSSVEAVETASPVETRAGSPIDPDYEPQTLSDTERFKRDVHLFGRNYSLSGTDRNVDAIEMLMSTAVRSYLSISMLLLIFSDRARTISTSAQPSSLRMMICSSSFLSC